MDTLKRKLITSGSFDEDDKSPTSKKDVKNLLLNGSKNLLGKVLSPTRDKSNGVTPTMPTNNSSNNAKPILMTRRELTDPFGSDDEDNKDSVMLDANENKQNSDSLNSPSIDPEVANVIFLYFSNEIIETMIK